MKKVNYLIYIVSVLFLVGCGGGISDNENNVRQETSSPKYDVYYCTSINTSDANGETVKSAIYGAHRESLAQFTKILDMSGKKKLVDSCAVDSDGNLYWTDRSVHGVFRADPDGQHVEQIVSGLDIPFGLAIDETNKRIYWSNWIQSTHPQSGEIGYSDLDGSDKKTIIRGLSSGGSLTIAQGKLFISDLFGGKIMKSDLDGGNLVKVTDANQPGQTAFDDQNNKLIWTDIADDKISSTNLNTLQTTDLIVFDSVFANPEALAIDKTNNRMLFIKPVENNGLGQNPSSQLHSADLNGNNVVMYSNLPVSLHAVQTLIVR